MSSVSAYRHVVRDASPDLAEVVADAYRRHRDEVYRLALRFGAGRRSWAEDVTQDVFVALCRTAHRITRNPDDPDDLRPWLYRVTANRSIQKLRRDKVRSAPGVRWLLRHMRGTEPTLDDVIVHRDDLRAAMETLRELPAKERVVFCMYHLDGLDMVEIGHALGHSKGYICKLIHRARARIETAGWEVDRD